MKPDFGLTAQDYGKHRAGFPDSLYDRLRKFGVGVAGQSVVDVGTGTGTLARGFAKRGCNVIGLDPAPALLEEARRLDDEAGVTVVYRESRAEDTGLEGETADVVTAGQCWHWFDRPAAAREAARVLNKTGTLVIAYLDWIPLAGNVVQATERLIEAHNPQWKLGGGFGLYPWWLRDLGEARFRDIQTFSYDLDVEYSPEAWRGRIRASAGVGASLSQEKVAEFDRDLASLLRERFPGSVLALPHRIFAIVCKAPESRP